MRPRRWLVLLLTPALLALPLATPPALAAPAPGAVLRPLQWGNDIALLLVARDGTTVALDPFDATTPFTADLALFTSSVHADQRTAPNVKALRLEHRVEARTVGPVKITGIAASHRGGPVNAAGPDHVIYRVEVDGVVLALIGCLGQERLTPEQLTALGPVDVAILTVDNGGFERLQLVESAVRMVQQLRPRAVIPRSHHADDEEARAALGALGTVETAPALALTREALPPGKTRILMLQAVP